MYRVLILSLLPLLSTAQQSIPRQFLSVGKDATRDSVQYSAAHTFYITTVEAAQREGWTPIRRLSAPYLIVAPPAAPSQRITLLLPANNAWKWPSGKIRPPLTFPVLLSVQVQDGKRFEQLLTRSAPDIDIIGQYTSINGFTLRIRNKKSFDFIREHPQVVFLDLRKRQPQEERALSDFDLGANRINAVRRRYPELEGQDTRISIKELRFDSLDIDLIGRVLSSPLADEQRNAHADIMSTIIAGAGNSYYTGQGVAPAAQISSSSFDRLLPDPDSLFRLQQTFVQNHSYGLGIENYYGLEAAAYDAQIAEALSDRLHVFSAGNIGNTTPDSGRYAGISGFANLTGTFKMAKNILTVGAVDSFAVLEERSSRGPAYDGRIKPELVAFGQDGSSGAAALVSGTALLLQQQHYMQTGRRPSTALLRAILLNSATDRGRPGPDFEYGYGNLHTLRAVQTLDRNHFAERQVSDTDALLLEVAAGTDQLKVTCAWTDPAAPLDAQRALQRDLDLRLIRLEDGQVFLPLVLNSSPTANALQQVARPGRDSLNNQEQILLTAPAPGRYQIQVIAPSEVEPTSSYALAWSIATPNTFQWTYPTRGDVLVAGRLLPLRWDSEQRDTFQLAYRYLGSSQWIDITALQPGGTAYYPWSVPDTLANVQFRMQGADTTYRSDTIRIAPDLRMTLLNDCPEEKILDWPDVEPATSYTLFRLEGRSMTPFRQTQQSLLRLPADSSAAYLAVAPTLADGTQGLRSLALRLDFQNAGCYLNSFFAERQGEEALLQLGLTTTLDVQQIQFEKRVGDSWQVIAAPPLARQTSARDTALIRGSNQYRAQIQLTGGQLLFSRTINVLYVPEGEYIVFPNPVRRKRSYTVFGPFQQDTRYQLYDTQGRLLEDSPLFSEIEPFFTDNLAPGTYFYQILKGNEQLQSGRLLVW